MARGIERGDVFLYPFDQPDKQRPVVVLTREAFLNVLTKIAVAPVTSTRRRSHAEVWLDEGDGLKGECSVNLFNVITVPKENLGRWVSRLSPARMEEVCAALRFATGCDCEE